MSDTGRVRMSRAIDVFIGDMRAEGRINSPNTEREYRGTLMCHAEDVDNRDPSYTHRGDVKRTLARWANPTPARRTGAILVSFYRWMAEEGRRPSNPAEQTKRPRRRKPDRSASPIRRWWHCSRPCAVRVSAG